MMKNYVEIEKKLLEKKGIKNYTFYMSKDLHDVVKDDIEEILVALVRCIRENVHYPAGTDMSYCSRPNPLDYIHTVVDFTRFWTFIPLRGLGQKEIDEWKAKYHNEPISKVNIFIHNDPVKKIAYLEMSE
jgi:hypothetical protein